MRVWLRTYQLSGSVSNGAEKSEGTDELTDKSINIALKEELVSKGDLVVIAAGVPINQVGSTNMLQVHVVGDILLTGKRELA